MDSSQLFLAKSILQALIHVIEPVSWRIDFHKIRVRAIARMIG